MMIEINNSRIVTIRTTDYSQIENLYYTVLCEIFLDKPALIITAEPEKKYSLGYEIAPFRELKIDKKIFLANEMTHCTSDVLKEISQSEEFYRGLLILMTGKENFSANLEEIIKHVHYKLGLYNLPCETVYCENDGKWLCLINTSLSPGIPGDVEIESGDKIKIDFTEVAP